MGGKMRADRDGDVKMDAGVKGGAGIKKSGAVKNAGKQAGQGMRAGRLAAHLAGSAAQREALKDAATRGAPTQPRGPGERKMMEVKITGWKKSKASDNEDGGVSSLLRWLEKKASTKLGSRARSVKVKKVCCRQRHRLGAGGRFFWPRGVATSGSLSFAANLRTTTAMRPPGLLLSPG